MCRLGHLGCVTFSNIHETFVMLLTYLWILRNLIATKLVPWRTIGSWSPGRLSPHLPRMTASFVGDRLDTRPRLALSRQVTLSSVFGDGSAEVVRYRTTMITRFRDESALLLIDVQIGVDVLDHWGGPTGRRNNPGAENTMASLLDMWRGAGLPVAFTRHDSREEASPLKFSLPTGAQKPGFEPVDSDIVVKKDVNSGFVGTPLEITLRRRGISRLVVVGFFTNMCVETTVRMAGNLGFDTYLVPDGCATTNRVGPDGSDHDPELVHQMTVANLHGEFCTAMDTGDIASLVEADRPDLTRSQGNE